MIIALGGSIAPGDSACWKGDVFGYLAWFTGDRSAAEDLAGETFERALRLWHRFDPARGSARTWLCQIGRTVAFACSPENLRLGRAIEIFNNPGRIVIGIRDVHSQTVLEPLLRKFCDNLIWMSVESAEMVKHAINAFLAVSVTFTNEIATLCERVGATASEVELSSG